MFSGTYFANMLGGTYFTPDASSPSGPSVPRTITFDDLTYSDSGVTVSRQTDTRG